MAGCLVGWWVGWTVGWLVGWLVNQSLLEQRIAEAKRNHSCKVWVLHSRSRNFQAQGMHVSGPQLDSCRNGSSLETWVAPLNKATTSLLPVSGKQPSFRTPFPTFSPPQHQPSKRPTSSVSSYLTWRIGGGDRGVRGAALPESLGAPGRGHGALRDRGDAPQPRGGAARGSPLRSWFERRRMRRGTTRRNHPTGFL